jgi:hypothetical protein
VPVSSPSYFPPQRGTDQIVGITAGQGQTGARVFLGGQSAGKFSTISDLIVIGHNALSAGTVSAPLSDANGVGTTVIGSNSAVAVTDFTRADVNGNLFGPGCVIGSNIAPLASMLSGSLMMGANILPNWNVSGAMSIGGNVVMGIGACSNPTGSVSAFSRNVIIGYQALQSLAGQQDITQSVFIGAQAGLNAQSGALGNIALCTVVGNLAGNSLVRSQRNTLLGGFAGGNVTIGNDNTCVGANSGPGGADAGNTLVGSGIGTTGSNNIIIGFGASAGVGGNRNVIIGAGAGANLFSTVDILYIQTFNSSTEQSLLYGQFNTGNLVLGNTVAASRDTGGTGATNIVKLTNASTTSVANPVGGGYLYCLAGALRYRGTSGTDTLVAAA